MALLTRGALTPSFAKNLVSTLIHQKHWRAIYYLLHKSDNIGEHDLIAILNSSLSASAEEITTSLAVPAASICFPFQQDGERDETIHEAIFRCITMYSVTPILMVRAMKKMTSAQVKRCLEMAQKWLERFHHLSNDDIPTNSSLHRVLWKAFLCH